MVQDENGDVIVVGQAQEVGAEEGAARQIKRFGRLFSREPFCLHFGIRLAAQIRHGQGQRQFGRNDLLRLPVHGDKGGAQNFVAADDFVEASCQSGCVERALEAQDVRQVVERRAGVKLVYDPQTLLGKRKRESLPCDRRECRRVTRRGRDRRQHSSLRRLDLPGQPGNGGRLEEGAQRQFDIEGVTHAGHELSCQQRMPAQLEEVVVPAHPLDVEKFRPEVGKQFFAWRVRRNVVCRRLSQIGNGQGPAVHLAARGQGQGFKRQEG